MNNNTPIEEAQNNQPFDPTLAIQDAAYLNNNLDAATTFIAENLRPEAPLLYAAIGLAEKTKSDIDNTLLEQVLQKPKNNYELEYATYYLRLIKKPVLEKLLSILLNQFLAEEKRSSVITNLVYALKLIGTESAQNTLQTLYEKYKAVINKPEMVFVQEAFESPLP